MPQVATATTMNAGVAFGSLFASLYYVCSSAWFYGGCFGRLIAPAGQLAKDTLSQEDILTWMLEL